MSKKICELPALERFAAISRVYDAAEKMVANANTFTVDETVNAIEEFLVDNGVEYGTFVERLRGIAAEKKAASAAAVDQVCRLLTALPK